MCYPAVLNIRICDPRLIPINQKIGSNRIEKSLYLIPADCKSAGTLALLVYIRRHGTLASLLHTGRHENLMHTLFHGSISYENLLTKE